MKLLLRTLAASILLSGVGFAAPSPAPTFAIQVVDKATGRGVPMVELQTTSSVRYYTDSNGLIAFNEPGLMGKKVWFGVSSHGYEFPPDGFGIRGVTLETRPGRHGPARRSSASTSPSDCIASPARGSTATRCCSAASRPSRSRC